MTERSALRLDGERAAAVAARPRAPRPYERFVKPLVDRLVAGVLALVLLPLVLLVALGVLVTLGRPILYRQERIGHGGMPFTMLKFRSMRHDRRRRRGRGYDGPERRRRHKSQSDPRHTRFGRFIRRFSLDELPQLWNVLRGDLSLVGPRPELPQVVEGYEPWQHHRHAVRPGVTGLWQVTERDHDGEMYKHVDLDLRYVEHLSPRLDLWIALRTPLAVLGLQAAPPRFLVTGAAAETADRPPRRAHRPVIADDASAA